MLISFLKSKSRTVHCQDRVVKQESKKDSNESCTSLTVWRKSLLLSCTGFTVIGPDGNIAYRVDNYTGRPNQIILMDGSGKPIFTSCHSKKLWLVDNYWHVYEGEVGKYCKNMNIKSSKKPHFCVRKNISIKQTKANVLAYVNCGMSDKRYTYVIEGSYTHRSCKILDESRRIIAEIKKKEAIEGVFFGLDVFYLIVKPGLDSRIAMVIVLLLDQMFL